MTENQQHNDLLDAFRYFNNEMSTAEMAAFEESLDGNFDLQSTLADVVLMQSALTSQNSLASQSETYRPVRSSRFAAILGGGLALAVLMSALVFKLPSKQEGSILLTSVDSPLKQTDVDALGVWTIMEGDSNVAANRRHLPADFEDNTFSTQADEELDIPDWMFAAVEASSFAEEIPALDVDNNGGAL
ncbi:MAG: hypothetical protein HON04_20285 [Planctomicrobium sp.]|jgi:hypothetical protein|nr:hypothetical protein [Planctomicrobium sp.]